MNLIERLHERSSQLALSGALAFGIFSSGCETPEQTWAMGGLAGANALYNSNLSPQSAAGLGLASMLLQSGANLQAQRETQEMIQQSQSQSPSYPSENRRSSSSNSSDDDPFILRRNVSGVGSVNMIFFGSSDKTDNFHYPEDFKNLYAGPVPHCPRGKELCVLVQTKDTQLRDTFFKVINSKGDTINETSPLMESSRAFIYRVNILSAGNYSMVFYGKRDVPSIPSAEVLITINPIKPWINLGALFGSKPRSPYVPPPQPRISEPEPTVFLGKVDIEVYSP